MEYSSSQHASPLRQITCHMGLYLAEMTFQPLPQPKLVLDLATPGMQGWVDLVGCYIPRRYIRQKTVIHPGTTNRARRWLTSYDERRLLLRQDTARPTTERAICRNRPHLCDTCDAAENCAQSLLSSVVAASRCERGLLDTLQRCRSSASSCWRLRSAEFNCL